MGKKLLYYRSCTYKYLKKRNFDQTWPKGSGKTPVIRKIGITALYRRSCDTHLHPECQTIFGFYRDFSWKFWGLFGFNHNYGQNSLFRLRNKKFTPLNTLGKSAKISNLLESMSSATPDLNLNKILCLLKYYFSITTCNFASENQIILFKIMLVTLALLYKNFS